MLELNSSIASGSRARNCRYLDAGRGLNLLATGTVSSCQRAPNTELPAIRPISISELRWAELEVGARKGDQRANGLCQILDGENL